MLLTNVGRPKPGSPPGPHVTRALRMGKKGKAMNRKERRAARAAERATRRVPAKTQREISGGQAVRVQLIVHNGRVALELAREQAAKTGRRAAALILDVSDLRGAALARFIAKMSDEAIQERVEAASRGDGIPTVVLPIDHDEAIDVFAHTLAGTSEWIENVHADRVAVVAVSAEGATVASPRADAVDIHPSEFSGFVQPVDPRSLS